LAGNVANVRAAYAAALRARNVTAAGELVASFGAHALGLNGLVPEFSEWASAALSTPVEPRTRLTLNLIVGATHRDSDELAAMVGEALSLAEQVGDAGAIVHCHALLAEIRLERTAVSLDSARRALALWDGSEPALAGAIALSAAVTATLRERRFDEAKALLEEHIALGTQRFGLLEPMVLFQVGRTEMLLGDLDTADRWFHDSLASSSRTDSPRGRSFALYGLGEVHMRRDQPAEALARYREAVAIDVLADPRELHSGRMMVAWAASATGFWTVAEEQVAILAASGAGPGVRACYHASAGALTTARSSRVIAHRHLTEGVRLWADMNAWDVVADLLDLMAQTAGDEARAELTAVAVELRTTDLPLVVAVDLAARIAADTSADHSSRK
jgi:tetratricopeptide (TPR) repeat protein